MKRTVLSVIVLLGLTLFPAAGLAGTTDAAFSDVSETDWFWEGVRYVNERGYMNGTGESSFSPGLPTSRAMLVTLLYRVEGALSVSTDHTFSDVQSGAYYEQAVTWASAHGIVTGYSAERFGPDDPITREQMATIFYRYAAMRGYDVSAEGANLGAYDDASAISGYAVDAMRWANAVGLINGVGAARLAPTGTTTRAQTAVILARFCQKYIDTAQEAVASESTTDGSASNGASGASSGGTAISGTGGGEQRAGAAAEQQPAGVDSAHAKQSEENLFLLSAAADDDDTVTLTLKLCGRVCLCGFDLRFYYDKNAYALQTLDTEQELQLFSARFDDVGSVSLNYSAAQNITKEKTLLKAVFKCLPGVKAQTVFSLGAVEVIQTDEVSEVVDADYTLTYCKAPSAGGAT